MTKTNFTNPARALEYWKTFPLTVDSAAPYTLHTHVRVDYPIFTFLTLFLFRSTHLSVVLSTANEMAKVTKSFRLGFGSFVDKPLAPYVDTYPPV